MSQNFDTFNTPHDALFLVFGVPNTKYLAFGTPDENALKDTSNLPFTITNLYYYYYQSLTCVMHEKIIDYEKKIQQ